MEKLQLLINECPNELYELVEKLYNEKFPKKKNPKTTFKFKVLGKKYDSNIVTKNYVSFISDIFKIHPYEMFEKCIHEYYISKDGNSFKQSHKIGDNFFITGYSSTEVKIKHIMNICDFLGINIELLPS